MWPGLPLVFVDVRIKLEEVIRVGPNQFDSCFYEMRKMFCEERGTGGTPGDDRSRDWRDAAAAKECQKLSPPQVGKGKEES